MIQFQEVQPATLDVSTGQITGLPEESQSLPELGMPLLDFIGQVSDLSAAGAPLEKVHAAIDAHPDLTDKDQAKIMAQKIYASSPSPALETFAK